MNTVFDPIVSEFDSSDHKAKYKMWVSAKVEKSRADSRPRVPHDQVVARLKRRRKEMLDNVR